MASLDLRTTVSARVLRAPLLLLGRSGVDASSVVDVGIAEAVAADADHRISLRPAMDAWDQISGLLGDEALGIHAAQELRLGDFDLLDFALRSAETFGQALQTLERFQHFIHSAAGMKLSVHGDVMRCELGRVREGRTSRHFIEFIFATWLVVTRELLGDDVNWIEAHFAHAAPSDVSEHARFFGCPLMFGAQRDFLIAPAAWAARALPQANSALYGVLSRHAQSQSERVPPSSVLLGRVHDMLYAALGSGDLSAGKIASALGVSERSLRRKLRAENTSFSEMRDAIRRDVGMRSLRDGDLSASEISFLLGYKESSGFARACQRWTSTAVASDVPDVGGNVAQ